MMWHGRRRRSRCGGFTLVEATISTLIVGGVFVAALTAVAASQAGRVLAEERDKGVALGDALMAEILNKEFGSGAIGRSAAEGAAATRASWDDVDDYHGLVESPPRDEGGAPIGDGSGWTRSVTVEWVRTEDPSAVAGSDSGAKRVTVTVSRGGRVAATLVALRTEAWREPRELWRNP